jgi:hypothetical protein
MLSWPVLCRGDGPLGGKGEAQLAAGADQEAAGAEGERVAEGEAEAELDPVPEGEQREQREQQPEAAADHESLNANGHWGNDQPRELHLQNTSQLTPGNQADRILVLK